MRKNIIGVLLVTSILFAGIDIGVSSFNDNSTFINSYSGKASVIVDHLEYYINASQTNTPTSEFTRLAAGLDYDIAPKTTCFTFVSNSNGTWRAGLGAGYVLLDNTLKFPYRHKVSFALVQDPNMGKIGSWRYKFKGYWNRVGLTMTAFHLGYTYTLDYKLKIPFYNDKSWIVFKGYVDEYANVNQNSLGLEFRL